MFKPFCRLMIAIAVTLTLVLGTPAIARADKIPKAIAFDPSAKSIDVAAIYETTTATQKMLIKSLKMNKAVKAAPGFQGLTLLKSTDGSRVISLNQWDSLASYQAYTPPAPESGKPVTAPTRTLVYEIETAKTTLGTMPKLRGKEAIVQFSEFSLKNATDAATVLTEIEKLVPDAIAQQPKPQSVTVFKASDGTDVAVLANWNCTADFEDLGTPTGVGSPNETVTSLVENDQRFYNVVKIIAAEPPKEEEA